MSAPIYIGIDPGRSGAIALVSEELTSWHPLAPAGEWIDLCRGDLQRAALVLVESQQWRGAQQERSPASTVALVESYGIAQGVLLALGARAQRVTAQQWRRALGLPRSTSYQRRKDQAHEYAQKHAANCPKWAADAVCIALVAQQYQRLVK